MQNREHLVRKMRGFEEAEPLPDALFKGISVFFTYFRKNGIGTEK